MAAGLRRMQKAVRPPGISAPDIPGKYTKKRKVKNKESSPPGGGARTLGTAGEDLEVQTASGAAEAADLPTTPKSRPQGVPRVFRDSGPSAPQGRQGEARNPPMGRGRCSWAAKGIFAGDMWHSARRRAAGKVRAEKPYTLAVRRFSKRGLPWAGRGKAAPRERRGESGLKQDLSQLIHLIYLISPQFRFTIDIDWGGMRPAGKRKGGGGNGVWENHDCGRRHQYL